LSYNYSSIETNNYNKGQHGFSTRCLKD
jgi:hypothetical protein